MPRTRVETLSIAHDPEMAQLMIEASVVNRLVAEQGVSRREAVRLVAGVLPEDDAEELYQHAVDLLRRQG